MEPLKNMYNAAFFESLTSVFTSVSAAFNKAAFMKAVYSDEWEKKELKQRIRHVSICLGHSLPGTYHQQTDIICKVTRKLLKTGVAHNSFPYICLPDFLEVHGLDDIDTSLAAMETITQFISCEFAIRPFLLNDQKKVMKKMVEWSTHTNQNVRRFSSEGCRPRLPWGKAIPSLKLDPQPILPILNNLKNDPSEFVRKSVANNINDIAKDNPEIVIQLIRKWKGKSKNTDWILKHGARTLLRKADPDVYKLFGLSGTHDCEISQFKVNKSSIRVGDDIQVGFTLTNNSETAELFRIELGVYYIKATGKSSRKLFKMSENTFKAGVDYHFKRKISFKDLTTRKHHPGNHAVSIVVNGTELETKTFTVV
jgi:3-methyladenine DNA glycosylase AlkC